jgi:hypothetical protein
VPETQYLFVTVIDIEARQYAKMEIGGLFVMFARGEGAPFDRPFGLDKNDSRAE